MTSKGADSYNYPNFCYYFPAIADRDIRILSLYFFHNCNKENSENEKER